MIKAEKEVLLAAVMQNGNALEFASRDLKSDKEVVLTAVMQYGLALDFASDDLKADNKVILAAVMQEGRALKYASKELKADKEVVLTAVMQYGLALKFASDDLKADKEVVLASVKQDGWELQFASDDLKKGGLRAYMDGLALVRRSLLFFLLSARNRAPLDVFELTEGHAAPHVRTTPEKCILAKLNAHGIYFAMKLKCLIAAFAGAPVGKALTTLTMAIRSLNKYTV